MPSPQFFIRCVAVDFAAHLCRPGATLHLTPTVTSVGRQPRPSPAMRYELLMPQDELDRREQFDLGLLDRTLPHHELPVQDACALELAGKIRYILRLGG